MHYPSNLGKNLFLYFRVELFSKVQYKILGAVSLLLKNPRECNMLVHKAQSCEQPVVCTPSNSLLVAFLLAHSHIRLSHRFWSQRETAHSLSFAPLNVHAFDWGREVSVGFSYWEFLETKGFEKSGFF